MRESQAIIERVRRVGSGWQQLMLAVEDTALEHIKPGQTLLVKASKALDPYLRENWIPIGFDAEQRTLQVEIPLKTAYTPGEAVSIIGPVGSAFPVRAGIRHLLLIAQEDAPTRLLFLMASALRSGISVTLVLAGTTQNYPINTLPPQVEVIQSSDVLTWPSQQQTFIWADQVFIVTRSVFWEKYYLPIFYAANKSRPALPAGFLHGVFDLPLPCGTGACMACMVRCLNGDRLVCSDGPAFDLASIKFL